MTRDQPLPDDLVHERIELEGARRYLDLHTGRQVLAALRGNDLRLDQLSAAERTDLVSMLRTANRQSRPSPARLSPRGDLLVVGTVTSRVVHFYAVSALAVAPLLGKPLQLMGPQDLATVVTAPDTPGLDEGYRTMLTLLRACLEHRFRHDVGLGGTSGGVTAAEHDIALGGQSGRGLST